jgi:AcrR family transcriptional regulator
MSDATRASVAAPRPLRADARRNFEAILASARESFADNGADASLEEIARRAGVGIGTLYRNFPARSDLINAVYVEELEDLCRTADDFADLPAWEALIAWLRRFAAYCERKRALVEGLNRDSPLFINAKGALYETGEPILERAQAAGDARSDIEIADVMYLISGVMSGTYATDDQRDRVLAVALDGLRARS